VNSADRGAGYRAIDALLTERASRDGARVYVESVGTGARLSFAELDAAANRVAHFLADRGVEANDRIAILSGNCLELVVLFFGIQRYGAAVNPINVEVNAKNVRQILRDVEPRLTLWSRRIPPELGALARAMPAALAFEETAGATSPSPDDLFAVLGRYPGSPGAWRVGGSRDIAIIDYTSGTTAAPKGVCISHEAYFYMCRAMVERLRLTEADRILECRALSWASPQVLSLGPTLQTGARLVLAPRFSQRRFFDWIRDHGVTVAAGVPTALTMLLDRPVPVIGDELPTLRFITSSAAPLPAERQLEFERRYRIPIVQGCGMTEAGFMGGNPPDARRPGSIGPAMPYLSARFVDDAGAICPPGQTGELVVSGPQLASAYLGEHGTLVPIRQDGFRTGDLGHVDADGYLYLTGRTKDLIIRGGVNIAPMEITGVLLSHPAVADAATIGVPDDLYGEAIVGFVVGRSDRSVSSEDLLAHCRTRLSDFKLPREIVVVEAIPRTDRGKVARDRLLARWRDMTRSDRAEPLRTWRSSR
jgi:acyl-coenzyme A synthetase/AMP-(fatty) acid ligase